MKRLGGILINPGRQIQNHGVYVAHSLSCCFQVPQFKAQPLPDFNTVVLPEKKKLEPTKPEPFRLTIDERGAAKHRQWEQMVGWIQPVSLLLGFMLESLTWLSSVLQVKEEQKQQEEAATFKARPNTVTHKEPFRPKKENRTTLGKIRNQPVV